MDLLSNLNLNSNQVQNMVLHPSGTAPTAKTGAIYFDTTSGVHAVKVYGTVGGSSGWRTLLDGRNGCVSLAMLACVLKDSDTNYLNSFAAGENTLIPTTGAVYGFFKDALKQNDAMVYMGTFAAQATSGVTLTKSMFTISGGGNPDNLTTWMSKGYTFKVTGSGYFGTIAVEPGDMIIVNNDSPGTTVSNYDIIQMNLTSYVTTFGGASGAITLPAAQADTDSNVGVNLSVSNNQLTATLLCDKPVVTWSGGTSNGPTLTVKAMGKTSAAKAIPAAAVDASGIVTTGTQTFGGAKTFSNAVTTNEKFVVSSPLTGVTTDTSSTFEIKKTAYTINNNSVEAWHILPYGNGTAMRPFHIGGNTTAVGLFYTGAKAYSGTTKDKSWGIGTFDPQYDFEVNGTFGAGASTFSGNVTIGAGKRIYFGTSGHYIEYDSTNNAIHTDIGIYSDGFVTAYGMNGSGGSGIGGHNMVTWADLQSYSEPATDEAEAEDVASAWAVKKLCDTCVRSVGTPTTDNSPQYVVTGITKSANGSSLGFSRAQIYYNKISLNGAATSIVTASSTALGFYAPTSAGTSGQVLVSTGSGAPDWNYADRIKTSTISSTITNGLNNQAETAGLFVCPFGFDASKTDKNCPASIRSGVMLRWNRYLGRTDGTVNTEVQLVTSTSANKLYFRNNYSSGNSSTIVWNEWLEVATIGDNGNGSIATRLIHSYSISAQSGGRSSYSTGYVFATRNLVAALYDASDNLVLADMSVVQDNVSSSDTYNKYKVVVNFGVPVTVAYRLVVYGL